MALYIYSGFPGQQMQIGLALTNAAGQRADSLTLPKILRIILPSLAEAAGYPQNMNKLDTGLYYFRFNIPTGATNVGSYLVDVEFTDPLDSITKTDLWQIIIAAPTGNYYVSGT